MAKSFSMESLNAAQRKAVQTLQGPVLILAGAGTGKTRTVTCRIAHMVNRGISPKSILAVTFTNKAALEMRERVGQMVERKAARQIMVSTFHSLCVRILREDIGRLGYKTNFTIYSGSEQSGLIRRQAAFYSGEYVLPTHTGQMMFSLSLTVFRSYTCRWPLSSANQPHQGATVSFSTTPILAIA